MSIIGDTQIIKQYAVNREVIRNVAIKYKINKRQFTLIACAYSLQSRSRPYFFMPDLIQRLNSVKSSIVWNDVKALRILAMINLEMRTRAFNPDLYCVTGIGLNVLKSYTNQVRHLVEIYSR